MSQNNDSKASLFDESFGDDSYLSQFDLTFSEENRYTSRGMLRQYWINERGSPEILAYEPELVEEIRGLIESQEKMIMDLRFQGGSANDLLCNLYQMELDRVSYILNSYIRIRLRKIEKHAMHILGTPAVKARLSRLEFEYAQGYVDLIEAHYNNSFLDYLPEKYRKLDTNNNDGKMVDEPDLDTHVFLRVKKDIGEIIIQDEPHDLRRNDIVGVSYRHMKHHLLEDEVELI